MSQIDKVIYLPVLCWFIAYLVALYAFTYSFFVPFILATMLTREELYDTVVLELSTIIACLPPHWGFTLANFRVCLWPTVAATLLLCFLS